MTTALAVPEAALGRPLLTLDEFRLFQETIHREAGIFLSEAKQALLAGRLQRRLRDLGLHSFAEYHQLTRRDPAERTRMLECICTHETRFFREPVQFDYLVQQVAPRWATEAADGRRPRRLRVWSAACSSGEEPYSLAMVLLDLFPGWDVEVLATDLSAPVLARAREGVWPVARAEEIPESLRRRFMLRGIGEREGTMKAGPEIRAVVRFQSLNLSAERWPAVGKFDLVLCRNVLIYFDPAGKQRVVRNLARHLDRGGLLFLGQSESLAALGSGLSRVGPAAYGAV